MSYNDECTCDANIFYKNYRDKIQAILSERFTSGDVSKTPSEVSLEDSLEDSLEEECYEESASEVKSPRGILHSESMKSPKKSVTFTDAVLGLDPLSDLDVNVVELTLDEEILTETEPVDEPVIENEKQHFKQVETESGNLYEESTEKVESSLPMEAHDTTDPKLVKQDGHSEKLSIASLKFSDQGLPTFNSEISLKESDSSLRSPEMEQQERDARLQYLSKHEDADEQESYSEKGDVYKHERIVREVKAQILTKYGVYEASSAGEETDRFSTKSECKTEEKWISKSQQQAEMYLKDHRVLELFHFLGSHLIASNTDNPIEFLIDLLDSCLKYRNGCGEPPIFFTAKYIKSLFDTMDKMNTGSISLNQYRTGMITLGIKEYEKYPKTDENYMVNEQTFTNEALKSLIYQLDEIIKFVPSASANKLLGPTVMSDRNSLVSA